MRARPEATVRCGSIHTPECSETFLSYTYACGSEDAGGSALVDTAAQHGLIGEQTLHKHDLYLQQHYRLRVQLTGEEGGTVRGVCGSEQVTKIAYIPIRDWRAGWRVAGSGGAGQCAMPLTRVPADADRCSDRHDQ